MRIEAGGFIYCSAFDKDWSQSMTAIPTPRLMGERIRIYFYTKDGNGDGRISYIEVSASDPSVVLYEHQQPVLGIGEPGDFDDCGVCPSCVIANDDENLLYYFGVSRMEKLPYVYFAGLAKEKTDGNFERISRVPILDRTHEEPHLRSACTVVPFERGYKMWYVSGSGWFEQNGKRFPRYLLRSALSSDGYQWNRTDEEVIPYASETEFGFGRPWVLKKDGVYHLFYSIRSTDKPYRIGYARSVDGICFERMDDQMVVPVEGSWDAEMTCYPAVIDTPYGTWMFYNGNGYGATGFGYLKIEW